MGIVETSPALMSSPVFFCVISFVGSPLSSPAGGGREGARCLHSELTRIRPIAHTAVLARSARSPDTPNALARHSIDYVENQNVWRKLRRFTAGPVLYSSQR